MHLKPIFKWVGGKRREIKYFEKYFPTSFETYVEPFVGGGAVYFYLNHQGKNIINDSATDLINFYQQIKNNNQDLFNKIIELSKIKDAKILKQIYLEYRSLDRLDNFNNLSETELAIRFIVVNQMAFMGLRRWGTDGYFNTAFNIPARTVNNNIKQTHISLLNLTDLYSEDFENILINNDNKNTFIFIDPPYVSCLEKVKKYSNIIFDKPEHEKLFLAFSNLKNAKVMIIIDKCDFTCKLYKDYVQCFYSIQYLSNKTHSAYLYKPKNEHLVITNY